MAVEPALGIANDPQCETSNNDCCNENTGILGIWACYGNGACQSGPETGFLGCTPGTGVDQNGCCSNYAASGIRGKTTTEFILYLSLLIYLSSHHIVFYVCPIVSRG